MTKRRKTTKYRISPSWRIDQNDQELRVYGGGDAEYLVALSDSSPSLFSRSDVSFYRKDLSQQDLLVCEQLLTAGVVEVIGLEHKQLNIYLVGDDYSFELNSSDRLRLVSDVESADIAVVVRRTSTHESMARRYHTLSLPHIYFDIAYHHTVSIGPLVYPGETACIGCLYGRIATRWGDSEPPVRPAVVGRKTMTDALLVTELEKIADGDTSLVGKAVAWDIDGRRVTVDTLLKSSACPSCGGDSPNRSIVV